MSTNPLCEDCRRSSSATGCTKHSNVVYANKYAGFSVDPDLIAEPGSLPPAKGHSMVPKPLLDEMREQFDSMVATANAVALQRDAANEDAARLAEALRHSPMVVGETATEATARWESDRIDALRLHDERVMP